MENQIEKKVSSCVNSLKELIEKIETSEPLSVEVDEYLMGVIERVEDYNSMKDTQAMSVVNAFFKMPIEKQVEYLNKEEYYDYQKYYVRKNTNLDEVIANLKKDGFNVEVIGNVDVEHRPKASNKPIEPLIFCKEGIDYKNHKEVENTVFIYFIDDLHEYDYFVEFTEFAKCNFINNLEDFLNEPGLRFKY